MINYYIVEIKGKNPKRIIKEIIKQKINIINIKYYKEKIILKVSYEDYKKIKEIKTSYEINIIKTNGKYKLYDGIRKYQTSIIFFILGIFLLIFLTKHTFIIEINTNNKEIEKILKKELKKNNITVFSTKKNTDELKEITTKIKNDNSNKIEWIEIEYKGVITKVKVIERITSGKEEKKEYKDIVAKKNGYIRKIYSSKGEILKNTNDYVKKGEIIISGTIFRNNNPITKVKANGKVYAEVWYILKLNKNINYKYLKETNKSYKKLNLKLLNNEYTLFKVKTKEKNNNTKNIFSNKLFSLYLKTEKIYIEQEKKYSNKELVNLLEEKAKKQIENDLEKDEYIIKQKTLKKTKENGKIYIDVFFKVYEDIAQEENIKIVEEKQKEKEE